MHDGQDPGDRLPGTPDFRTHAPGPAIAALDASPHWLSVRWSDGTRGRFNRFWLRENEVRDGIVDPVTRERTVEIDTLPDGLAIGTARLDEAGAILVAWTPDGHASRHHPGWLWHTALGHWRPGHGLPDRVSWRADAMPEPPTFDGPSALGSDTVLGDWLTALWRHGLARLSGLPAEEGTVLDVARRIGTVRASNFGYVFRVETKPDPDSSAYTTAGLPAHTDLASREVQPGLQLLHCLENGCRGGASTMADGFAVASAVRDRDADAFEALTTLGWNWSNRHSASDYRFSGPIVTLRDGAPDEIRYTSFLRAEPDMPDDQVERAYRALRLFARLAADSAFVCRTPFRPGDLVIFDNRRILHGRDPFETGGARRLEGCYMERDELFSRLRVLARKTG